MPLQLNYVIYNIIINYTNNATYKLALSDNTTKNRTSSNYSKVDS